MSDSLYNYYNSSKAYYLALKTLDFILTERGPESG